MGGHISRLEPNLYDLLPLWLIFFCYFLLCHITNKCIVNIT